jgi:hypothetical protein
MAEAEWRPGFTADPSGTGRRLLPVRVEDCEPAGLLADRVYVDLVGLDEATARARLREELGRALRGPGRPTTPPRFPHAPVQATVERPRFPTALPPVWNVPYRRNPDFTGREQPLADLASQLSQGAATAITQALQGGGGVGKTALAVEYAYRHRSEFDAVWWVQAEGLATLVGDLAGLAVALRLAEAGQADQQVAVLAVRRWLDGHDRWLLVLDNAQAPDTPTGLRAPLARLVDLIPQMLTARSWSPPGTPAGSATPNSPSSTSSLPRRRPRFCWPARAAVMSRQPGRSPSCWAGCRWRWNRPARTCARPVSRLPPTWTGCASSRA